MTLYIQPIRAVSGALDKWRAQRFKTRDRSGLSPDPITVCQFTRNAVNLSLEMPFHHRLPLHLLTTRAPQAFQISSAFKYVLFTLFDLDFIDSPNIRLFIPMVSTDDPKFSHY